MLSPAELSSLYDHFSLPDDPDGRRRSTSTEPVTPTTLLADIPRPLSLRRLPPPPPPPRNPQRASLPPSRRDALPIPETRTAGRAAVRKAVSGGSFRGTFVSLCLVNLVCAIDSSVLAVALPVSREDLSSTRR
jgi:hypothetical protein